MATGAAERAGYGAISVLALGVGILIGANYCQPPTSSLDKSLGEQDAKAQRQGDPAAPQCAERVVERFIESPPKIIYECPPEPEPEPVVGEGKKTLKPKKELPEPEPELDPLERQRLLAWVRERSVDLKRCRDDSKEIYRVAVIMHLDKSSRELRRVDVNADKSELPSVVLSCLQREILRWQPPKELTKQRTKIVFGLNL